jgi:hypothetical protein
MKKVLLLFFLIGFGKSYSQNLIQTYVDRCTGEVKVFSVPMNGQTVVAFYNKSKTFTAEDFRNGNLQFWLEETYLWWSSLNPCSTTTTGAVTTQQTTQQVTQQATQAATNAVATTANTTIDVPPTPVSTPPTPSPPETAVTVVDTPSTDTTAATTDIGSQGSSNELQTSTDTSGTTETTTTETQNNTNETETTSTEATQSSDENTTSDQSNETSGETETTEGETQSEESSSSENDSSNETEESSEEVETEETSEESNEESSEESSEEETKEEESSEEESTEEESEEESDDSTEESEEKEEGDKKKKKRALAPPIISANVMSMQDPFGKFSTAANVGMSQSSLMGDKTYGLNAMVYSNMQQFMLNANFSKVHINDKGRVNRVYSVSMGGAKMYTTYMAMTNHSLVFLGKKGSVFGTALGLNLTSLELDIRKGLVYYNEQILGANLTTFYTKPFNFDRLTISPMLAASAPFASMDLYFGDGISFNKDVMFITGSSFNYQLTKRFIANIGANAISSTIKDFPVIWSFTIGSRFQF